jgi:hypothetical protein
MKKSRRFGIALSLLTTFLFLGLWVTTYPGCYDPKNVHYLLWKHGLASIDIDRALSIMTHDDSQPLVVGKSEDEVRKRFGYLRSLDEARPYLQGCYRESAWNKERVMFLRDSEWMVIFRNGKATDLILVKGC